MDVGCEKKIATYLRLSNAILAGFRQRRSISNLDALILLPPLSPLLLYHSTMSEKSATYKMAWASAMLASGTFTTIFAKALFETEANGSDYCDMDDDDDKHCKFNKPWYVVSLYIPIHLYTSLSIPIHPYASLYIPIHPYYTSLYPQVYCSFDEACHVSLPDFILRSWDRKRRCQCPTSIVEDYQGSRLPSITRSIEYHTGQHRFAIC